MLGFGGDRPALLLHGVIDIVHDGDRLLDNLGFVNNLRLRLGNIVVNHLREPESSGIMHSHSDSTRPCYGSESTLQNDGQGKIHARQPYRRLQYFYVMRERPWSRA